MEVKVYVEGVQRIVCGVTKKTTCQEVVIALARALGRTGRYTLREKFKDYERNMSPDECLLESLEKYGEQGKEVQLTLKHIGPSQGEETNQPKAQLRRVEGTGRVRRGSGAIATLHRQSLPPLSRLCLHPEPPTEEAKRPKRKSLTLMEEAWGWLENLGRGGKQQSGRDKGKDKEGNKGNGHLDNTSLKPTKSSLACGTPQTRDKKDKNRVAPHQPLISCLGNRGRCCDESTVQTGAEEDLKNSNKVPLLKKSLETQSEETVELRRLVVQQHTSLQELKLKIESTDQLIFELEHQQAAKDVSDSELPSDEEEQLKFWINELKAEEVFEKDLQNQFFEIKAAAAECKATLEEFKQKLQTMDLRNLQKCTRHDNTAGQISQGDAPKSVQTIVKQTETSADRSHENDGTKRVVTTLESKLPYVFVSANHLSYPSQCGPADLREWWTRWSQSQSQTSVVKPKTVHRSEITIQLGSTRV